MSHTWKPCTCCKSSGYVEVEDRATRAGILLLPDTLKFADTDVTPFMEALMGSSMILPGANAPEIRYFKNGQNP